MPSVAGIKAGQAYVVIGAVDDVGKTLAKIGRRIQSWGRSLTSFGVDAIFKTAFATFPGVVMIKWATTFEDNMQSIKSKIGATNAEMLMLRDTAMSAGKDLGITANQVSNIMLELSTRGKNAKEINDLTRPIALLAKATGSGDMKDMQQAAALMVDTLNAYHIPAKEAAKITDQLAIAANKSSLDLESTAVALAHITSAGAQFGVPLTDLISMVAVLKNIGITAETAAIAIRNIQLRTANLKLGQEFNDSLKSFGIAEVAFADATGKLKQPAALMFEIFDKIKGLGNQAQVNILGDLFGTRAFVPAAGLGGQQAAFDDLVKAMNQVNGDAQKIAQEMEQGIGGSFRTIKTSVESLAIQFEIALAPSIRLVSFKIRELIDALSQWISIHPKLTTLIAASTVAVAGFSVSLIGLGIAIRLVGVAISGLALIFLSFNAIRRAVVVGFLGMQLVLTGITAAFNLMLAAFRIGVAIMFALETVFFAVSAAISATILTFKFLVMAIGLLGSVASISYLVIGLTSVISVGYTLYKMFGSIALAADQMGNRVVAGLGRAETFIGFFVDNIQASFTNLWRTIVNSGLAAFNQLSQGFSLIFKLAEISQFENAWKLAIATVSTAFMNFFDAVSLQASKTFTDILNGVFQVILELSNSISRAVVKMGNNPAAILFQQMNEGLGLIMDSLGKTITRRRQGEEKDADDAEQRKFWRDFDLDQLIEGLKEDLPPEKEQAIDAIADRLQRFEGNPPQAQVGGQVPPALEGLEKGTIEAAKAAYENQMGTELGERQLHALEGIEAAMNELNDKIQVA